MLKGKRSGIIGTGNMGEALISGLVHSRSAAPKNIICSDARRERLNYIKNKYGVTTTRKNNEVVKALRDCHLCGKASNHGPNPE